ncbi:hypothetical protein R3P38DRAFT_3232422 [Favolaschia claudopus]|uniref:Uncharacterized protein n=1 Tax=Favolaschia claudopus TaxID=2862362 RepID=A0AAV9ZJF2_9AGAR
MDLEATALPTFQLDSDGIPPPSEQEETGEVGPMLPAVYLLSVPHPKDRKHTFSEVISLSHPKPPSDIADLEARHLENMLDAARPWAPWESLADFGYTETAVKGVLSKEIIDMQLKGFSGPWSNEGGSKITLRDYKDYKFYLEKARVVGVQFLNANVEAELWGEPKKYTFYYRDPWEWILSLVTDPGLARVSQWQSRRLYYCENGQMERYVHEPFSADCWNDVDSELPPANPFMHCWLPLHIWLDKGLVTSHVKMFPIVLRALWLPSEIRNASGNGGGVIIGFMVMVDDPGHPKDRTERQNYAFAQFKREIYQQSWFGEPVRCGDEVVRNLYPGFLIESLDFEEAWNFTCCRAGRAKHPCARCLVSQEMLDCLGQAFPSRSSKAMKKVVEKARSAPTAAQREKLLMDHGLHDVPHFMWNIRFSDPYLAFIYDLLHFLESGKWGHHLWSLTLDILEKLGLLREATVRMAKFSRWRDLKHINDLATKDFTDGQTHLDILKCIVYILCEILPPKSTLIPCIRALLKCRMLLGLRVMTTSRQTVAQQYIEEYEQWCKRVSENYGKNFKFPKQHFLVHALDDVRMKGVLRNGTTRTGEGTHQEISVRDEDQEVVARTRLLIDDFFKQASRTGEQSDATGDSENSKKAVDAAQFKQGSARRIPKSRISPAKGENQWIFGSPLQHGDSRSYEDLHGGDDPVYRSLDSRLRDFLHSQYPDEYLGYEDTIMIEVFRCVYLEYQSKDDWTTAEDILRCHTNWYNSGPRYDCVLFNSDQPSIACARLRSLIRCELPSSRVVDLAVVQNMKHSKWRPKTSWDGCVVLEEEGNLTFLLMDYVIRGALLTPAEGPPNSRNRFHYLVDAVDGDMFLRVLNATGHVCN